MHFEWAENELTMYEDITKEAAAMLEAAGIPAFVDGNASADEFAMSQRLLNVSNVRVLVPTEALERALDVLKPTEVDVDDLAQQAMDAADDPDAEREV